MKTIKVLRLIFAFVFGVGLLLYSGYAWHVEWIGDWQALTIGTIGAAFAFVPHIIIKVLGEGLPKIFELTIGRFFNNRGGGGASPTTIFLLVGLVLSGSAIAQAPPINTSEARFQQRNDSTIISNMGQIRWDNTAKKFRFGNGTTWGSFLSDEAAG